MDGERGTHGEEYDPIEDLHDGVEGLHDPGEEFDDPADEYDDPLADFYDPDSDSLTIPAAPEVTTDPSDAPREVASGFWIIVLTLKIATLAGAVGALALIDGRWTRIGAAGLAAGLALFVLAARRHRSITRSLAADGAGEGPREDGRENESVDEPNDEEFESEVREGGETPEAEPKGEKRRSDAGTVDGGAPDDDEPPDEDDEAPSEGPR